jgi:hypothetical protein
LLAQDFMTDKQKLKALGLGKRIRKIETDNPEINFQEVMSKFSVLEKYQKLFIEYFRLDFEIKAFQK